MKHTIQEDNWREEFEDGSFRGYPEKYKVFLVPFIENLLASQLQSINSELDKMKTHGTLESTSCPDGIIGCAVYHCKEVMSSEDKVKNETLSIVQSIISNRMGEKI